MNNFYLRVIKDGEQQNICIGSRYNLVHKQAQRFKDICKQFSIDYPENGDATLVVYENGCFLITDELKSAYIMTSAGQTFTKIK